MQWWHRFMQQADQYRPRMTLGESLLKLSKLRSVGGVENDHLEHIISLLDLSIFQELVDYSQFGIQTRDLQTIKRPRKRHQRIRRNWQWYPYHIRVLGNGNICPKRGRRGLFRRSKFNSSYRHSGWLQTRRPDFNTAHASWKCSKGMVLNFSANNYR